MPGHAVTWLDVFTATPLAGNGLAVVHDADDVDDATMQAIARETRLSETTFVQTADADGADYRNRIFTVTAELPFAGHPSLGTAVAVARARGETDVTYVQQTIAGLQPIDVRVNGAAAYASMLQNPAAAGVEPDPAHVLAAIGLREEDGHPAWRPQVVSTGTPHIMLPLAGEAALARAAPQPGLLPQLLDDAGAICVYPFEGDPVTGEVRARSFFLGDAGVLEDPATGSAAGPLLAYLAERAEIEHLRVQQGVHMGRPSTLDASLEGDRIRVSGDVVVIADGRCVL